MSALCDACPLIKSTNDTFLRMTCGCTSKGHMACLDFCPFVFHMWDNQTSYYFLDDLLGALQITENCEAKVMFEGMSEKKCTCHTYDV